MFRKLHLQMSFFCTFVISLIILMLTLLCLFLSESNLRKNAEASFLKEINSLIIHIQSQDTLSLQWQNELQANNHFSIYFYDNGETLYAQRLHADVTSDALVQNVKAHAAEAYNIHIEKAASALLPSHREFSYSDDTLDYYVSVGTIPKGNGTLGFVVLYPLAELTQQVVNQRLLFGASSLSAILLLGIFCWYFTGRMLAPVAKNHQKQVDFVSAASHELRAPLAVILSGTEALEKAESDADRAHFLGLIQQEGIRMQHLISDLLFLARSDSNQLPMHSEIFQPELLLLDIYEQFEALARKKKLSLRLCLSNKQPPSCWCDPERLTQLFTILLDNAFSYTPPGGQITLSLQVSTALLCFSVSDTGCGIPDDQKELIFNRFHRVDTSHSDKQHFGLGLCLAREIASAHHGRLWVEDSAEGGSRFLFTLPPAP